MLFKNKTWAQELFNKSDINKTLKNIQNIQS